MIRDWLLLGWLISGCISALVAGGASTESVAVEKGRGFLVNLFDAQVGLLPEFRGASVYWLFHDNYLAMKVLSASNPQIAKKIKATMDHERITKSGKIEILFGEAEHPVPFHQFELTTVRQLGNKVIRTERVTNRTFDGWQAYADLLLLAAIAETNRASAQQHFDAALRLWDGHGFMDAAAKHDAHYATYKLGLALVAGKRFSRRTKHFDAVLSKLLALQDNSGGWVTDYDDKGNKLGVANVETTCLCILGLEAYIDLQRSRTTK